MLNAWIFINIIIWYAAFDRMKLDMMKESLVYKYLIAGVVVNGILAFVFPQSYIIFLSVGHIILLIEWYTR